MSEFFLTIVSAIYNVFWGDWIHIPLPNGATLNISLLVVILIPVGIYFTIRTKFLPIRMFPEMIHLTLEKGDKKGGALSGFQALIVSTATRVGMGNMVGVVAAVAIGGAGAVFWMWITAIIGAATAFAEATLAQMYKEKDPLYGGYRGGPAYYLHAMFAGKNNKKSAARRIIPMLFAISGLICWCGVSQVVSNSVTDAFKSAFNIPPIVSTVIIVALAAVIVLRKNMTVKVLDIMVPIMAGVYFVAAIVIIIMNAGALPSVFKRIIDSAFDFRAVAGGGVGAALVMGVKRGLFSNEAGSGSAPCAAAAANVSHPAKAGLTQAFGVIIDTIVICTCTAMIMLLAPAEILDGAPSMGMLVSAMDHHFGAFGVWLVTITLGLFCFSTFIGILYYARSNVAYIFGDNWVSQTAYKIVALIMLFIGGLAAYTFVWDIGDIGIALMTVFNMVALLPMSNQAIRSLKDYTEIRKREKAEAKAKKVKTK